MQEPVSICPAHPWRMPLEALTSIVIVIVGALDSTLLGTLEGTCFYCSSSQNEMMRLYGEQHLTWQKIMKLEVNAEEF